MVTIAAGYDGSIRFDTSVDASGFNKGIANVGKSTSSFSGALSKIKGSLGQVGTAIAGAFVPLTIAAATTEVIRFGQESVKAATDLKNAMTGLQSIVEGQGRSFDKAQKFLNEYVSDGLIPMTNAATAYKNLASRGYDDTQIENVLTALKDASAFGRQASLSMGEAVQSATEGLKNENSILVDNAGVTKNVAKMWDDYAKSIGTTANNLTQQQKIQAEVNGIMEETRFQTGDAAKVATSFSGQLSQISYHFNELKIAVGDTLIPILEEILPILDSIVQGATIIFRKLADIVQLITGKNNDIADSAGSAADAEDGLADSIQNASKEAEKALANFDDLNILQLGATSNNENGGTGSSMDTTNNGSLTEALNQGGAAFGDFGGKVVLAKNDLDNFKTSLETVKAEALEPIVVAEPVINDIPDPVYNPNWGLDTSVVNAPIFSPIPSPVYNPNWGLEVPTVSLPVFPLLPTPIYTPVWNLAASLVPELAQVDTALATVPLSFQTVAQAIAVSVGSWPDMASSAATSVLTILSSFASASASNIAAWGTNVMTNFRTVMSSFIESAQAGLTSTATMFANWINSTSSNIAAWGNNVASNIASAVSGLVSSIGSGLSSAWESISGFASSVGASIGNWWNDNKSWVVPVAGVTLAGIAVGAVVLSGGAALPAVSTLGTAALASAPALANGAVIPPNSKFLAMLGDQTSGRNLEAPENLIRQIVREESGIGDININIQYTGDLAQLARTLNPVITAETKRVGVNLITKGGV